LGTLHEFTIAMETDKPIGFLQGAGGIGSEIMDILHASGHAQGDDIVFSEDPKELFEKLMKILDERYKEYIDLYD